MARFVVLVTLLVLAACGQDASGPARPAQTAPLEAAPAFRNVQQETAYVGDQACFDCHEDLWRGYQTHGMARSYYPLTRETAIEPLPAGPIRHDASGFVYRVFAENGRYFQEEYRLDAAGRKTHRLLRSMDYVMGSGNAARTYLTDMEGRLYELPLTFYTQAKRWDFSPGYRERNGRFDRLIPDACMACHNGFPTTVPFVKGKYTDVPNGIGCERCHGPGALHVEERLAVPEPEDEIDPTIVNPAHLSLDRQLDVCQQCHLHGTVEVERMGRDPFAYRPSEPLSAHIALFSRAEPGPEEKISVISHADRMKRSACFVATAETDAPMTCVTCHDPHQGFREKGPAYFNATCQTCHTADALAARFTADADRRNHAATANCFGCHMPRVEAEDAPHSSFTDHWIRVVGREEDLPDPLAAHTPGDLTPYFDRDRSGHEAALYKGMALVKLGSQRADTTDLRAGVRLLEETLRTHPDYAEAQLLLGLGFGMLRQPARAVPAFEQAVRLDPDNPEYLYGLADAYEKTRRDPDAIIRLYERALQVQPALAKTRVNYGRFLEGLGRLDDAVEQYRQAAAEEPWLAQAHYNLGTAYLQQQQFGAAEAALLQALELEPDYTDALGNLGLLYINQGKTAQARSRFEQAVAAAPNDPLSLGNLGTFYLNHEEYDRAVDLLTRAVEINPQYLNGLVNLSLAHFRNEDLAQARHYARRALEIDPQNDKARQLFEASS